MENTLAHEAIDLALAGRWEEASKLNLKILENIPDDTDSLNRLARCYAELGETKKAIESTQKVLKLDPQNTIAQKCLAKWKSATPVLRNGTHEPLRPESFLEESGKTKILPLLNPGDTSVFANLNPGDDVRLSAYAHKVSVTDTEGRYIGRLPDDIAARLKSLLKNGVKYQVMIKSVDSHNVSVFIRETENRTELTSFPPEKIDYVTFTPPELVHRDAHEMVATEEVLE